MIFYFSGTGNSKWVALQLADKLEEKLVFIPEAIRDSNLQFILEKDEKVGFVFPVYSWGPPKIVLQFINHLILRDYHSHYLYFVCTCGDDIGLTQQVFCRAIIGKGWECNAGYSVIMPNNYVTFPGFDIDPKEVEDKKLKEAAFRMLDISGRLAGRIHEFNVKEGRFPGLKTRVINPLFNRYILSAKPFYATDSCVACKRCERVCPMENVLLVEQKPIWGSNCVSCLACYHVCPQHAVQYGKQTQSKGQYFNPNV